MSDALRAAVIDSVERSDVPRFNLAQITARAERQAAAPAPRTRKRSWLLGALLIGVPILAAATTILPSPELRHEIAARLNALGMGGAKSVVYNTGVQVTPDASTLARASFHVVLLKGLPTGSKLQYFQANNDGSFNAAYRIGEHGWANVMLSKSEPGKTYVPWVAFMRVSNDTSHVLKAEKLPAHVWIVGDEVVTIIGQGMTAEQLATMKAAMGAHDAPAHNGPVH